LERERERGKQIGEREHQLVMEVGKETGEITGLGIAKRDRKGDCGKISYW